jgi:hypothetical protein
VKLLIRLGILVLAAVGIKYLYERYAKREGNVGTSGGLTVLDSAKDAARDVVDHAKVAASEVADHAKTAASEVVADARARADDVSRAVQETADEAVSSDGGGTPRT